MDLDFWKSDGDDLSGGHGAVNVICGALSVIYGAISVICGVASVICRDGRNKQHSEAQKQPTWQQCGTEDCHGPDLFGNCWAWN